MKIVVLDGYTLNPGDLSWEEVEKAGDLTVYPRTSPEEVVQRAKECEIVLTNKTPLDAKVIAQLPQLRYIGVLATGYNVIDTEAARRQGIVVCNIPAYSTRSVAQHVFALILAITNRVEHYAEQVQAGQWSVCPDFCYHDTTLSELAGKRIGIVGLGSTGSATAAIAQAFGMKPIAYTSKRTDELPAGVTAVGLDELFATSDIVSLHCPLTADTLHLVDERRLQTMKPYAILINTGRGPLIDENDVAKALNSGKLAAYGADVLSTEPPAADNPLLTARNAYITPHIAWATPEARRRLIHICANNIQSFLQGNPINVVNL